MVQVLQYCVKNFIHILLVPEGFGPLCQRKRKWYKLHTTIRKTKRLKNCFATTFGTHTSIQHNAIVSNWMTTDRKWQSYYSILPTSPASKESDSISTEDASLLEQAAAQLTYIRKRSINIKSTRTKHLYSIILQVEKLSGSSRLQLEMMSLTMSRASASPPTWAGSVI